MRLSYAFDSMNPITVRANSSGCSRYNTSEQSLAPRQLTSTKATIGCGTMSIRRAREQLLKRLGDLAVPCGLVEVVISGGSASSGLKELDRIARRIVEHNLGSARPCHDPAAESHARSA
jgi:hypothetical protein